MEAGLLSEERALQQYGVKVYRDHNEWKIDDEQTSRLREKMNDADAVAWDFGKQRANFMRKCGQTKPAVSLLCAFVHTQQMSVRTINMRFILILVIDKNR